MKKIKKFLCVVLAMIMLVGSLSVSVTANTGENRSKTAEEWELIYNYYYEYGKNDFYSVKIYRNEIEEISDSGKITFTTKYKFVVQNNDDLTIPVEYITQNAIKWSPAPSIVKCTKVGYSKTLCVDYENYKNNKTYHDKITGEILQIAIIKDKYLHMSYLTQYQKKIYEQGHTHICYTCFDNGKCLKKDTLPTCKTKNVCRYCKGDLEKISSRKAVCIECNKSQYLSLTKQVCSVCKNENLTSVKSLWGNLAIYSIREVQEDFTNLVNNNTNSADRISILLKKNWEQSENPLIKKGREIESDWETAANFYDNLLITFMNQNDRKDLFEAVYTNRQETFKTFSETETKALIIEYFKLAMQHYSVDINDEDAESYYYGELDSDKLVRDYGNGILKELLNKCFSEIIPNSEDIEILVSTLMEHKEIREKLENEEMSVEEFSEYGVTYALNFIKDSLGNEFVDGLFDGIADIQNAVKEAELCLKTADDFTNYYDSTFKILMGNSISKKTEISSLCDDIALAAMLQHVQENY